jgi:hypothetical protein
MLLLLVAVHYLTVILFSYIYILVVNGGAPEIL